MKNTTLLYLSVSLLISACGNKAAKVKQEIQTEDIAVFTSSDSVLQKSFNWAKKQALSYAHDDSNDPVGAWYEAALPQREAFCMRDVSHQSVGAHILGLSKHNKNMMRKFAQNISESRDYCSFWEINRYDKPAPADYASDSEFWYNLNANFDVMQACLKMYEWTADSDYISGKDFTNFYDLSVNEYLDKWQLRPENIMDRPSYMNQAPDFNEANNFHSCRGLPSYVENFRGLTLGVDLLAALHSGFEVYSRMAALNGDASKAAKAANMATAYRDIIDSRWWDEENNRYNTFWTTEKKFYRGEGVPFILWFDATDMTDRKNASVNDILAGEWNVENMLSLLCSTAWDITMRHTFFSPCSPQPTVLNILKCLTDLLKVWSAELWGLNLLLPTRVFILFQELTTVYVKLKTYLCLADLFLFVTTGCNRLRLKTTQTLI